MRLRIEQEPTVTEDIARVDNAGRLIILGDKRAVVEDGRIEEFRIMMRHFNELARSSLV